MSTDPRTHQIEIPVGRNGGLVWNRLHAEREGICEAMLMDCQTVPAADGARVAATINWHRELLQARLRKIDDAIDRLMSGSYGHCSKCNRWIEDTKLEFDPAIALCVDCWEREQDLNRPVSFGQDSDNMRDSNPGATTSLDEVALETLHPYDTLLIRTLHSDYRIMLLDPKTGRALVEGGKYIIEPTEAVLAGSKLHGLHFKFGSIVVGYHLEIWIKEQVVSTSRVQSISIEHHDSAESLEAIKAAIH